MESFGARLKRERERRKITLDDISVSTKIGTRFLVALEEDHFDQLPGGIFNKGFVRAYARHLGIDENQAVADFVAASGPALPEVPPPEAAELAGMAVRVPETVRKSRGNDGIPWGLVAVALLVLAFAFALWGFYSREKPPHPSSAVPGLVPAEPSTGGAQTEAPKRVQPLPETVAPVAEATPHEASTGAAETGTAAAAPAPASNTGGFVVLIRAREDSWISITGDGKQIIQETLSANAERSIAAHNQIVIKAGNVGALDISFNGNKLPPEGHYNQVKTLTFNANGLQP